MSKGPFLLVGGLLQAVLGDGKHVLCSPLLKICEEANSDEEEELLSVTRLHRDRENRAADQEVQGGCENGAHNGPEEFLYLEQSFPCLMIK